MSGVFTVFAENYGETILRRQHSNLCFPPCSFSTLSPTHFLHDRKQCPVSTVTNQRGCRCARTCKLAKQRGRVSWAKECVLRNQGESFLVSVPGIVLSPWKSMPVVGRQSPLSCVCLYVWKNTHQEIDPQSTFGVDHTSEKCLPIENTLTLLQGAKLSYTSPDIYCMFKSFKVNFHPAY